MRQSDQELTSHILAEANQVRDQDFVGFDFAGDEHHYPPQAIDALIQQVKSYNRPMTLHAGECTVQPTSLNPWPMASNEMVT